MTITMLDGKNGAGTRGIDAIARDLAVKRIDDPRERLLARVHEAMLDATGDGNDAVVRIADSADRGRDFRFMEMLRDYIENDKFKEIGKTIHDESLRVKRDIEAQASRKYPSFDPAAIGGIAPAGTRSRVLPAIASIDVLEKPFYFADDGDLFLLHGIIVKVPSGTGKPRKAFSGFTGMAGIKEVAGDSVDPRKDDIVSFAFDGACFVAGSRGLECHRPVNGSYEWGFRHVKFPSKKASEKFMAGNGFVFRGYNDTENGVQIDRGFREGMTTTGENCTKKTGEQCFLRWDHPGTGIRAVSTRRESSGDLGNLRVNIPAGSMDGWAALRDKIEGRSGDEYPFAYESYTSQFVDKDWIEEARP
jgi:hypothetical protein